MNAQDLTLNIAVNMGRLGRWVDEGKTSRTTVFLEETWDYLQELEKINRNPRFEKTLKSFKDSFQNLKNNSNYDENWAEEALTWANILQHRAKLA
ncbi:MAG: hypothetical protein A3F35_03070 [Candidatus Woykebacteria bacterium RIFCSPHIGHO2_12_FULL_45_10]|uniref:Uncharacterized protein n=1 Tax=Candidatus Woykebacteria bacterium RIFCSPHIGHO2_12_FULL_45_10 TaxID=1802603 RepID=A0A1G1WN20_9BACT|nr:MAG: hypothetical protein A3F35_03070 [Candidatus Woykebacteria bacterium RIFCSPHIGHO2_12_FULL_45_10]